MWTLLQTVRRCGSYRPLAGYEPDTAPLIRCSRFRRHRPPHRSAFGLEWSDG